MFLARFTERRDSIKGQFALGFVDWNRRFMLSCVRELLHGPSTLMFTKDQEFLVHPSQGPCPSLEAPTNNPESSSSDDEESENEEGEDSLTVLKTELVDFPWGKRAVRLLAYLRQKGVVKNSDILEGVPLVDVLKTLCTQEPPSWALQGRPKQQERILKLLKRLKTRDHLLVPASYITNRAVAAVFWPK